MTFGKGCPEGGVCFEQSYLIKPQYDYHEKTFQSPLPSSGTKKAVIAGGLHLDMV